MSEFVILITGNFTTRFLFLVALFLVGLVLISRLDASPKPMGRFAFGIIYGFSAAMLGAGPTIWSMVSASSIDAATLAYLCWMLCFLMLVAFGSRRRSLDAYGDTRQAYYACVPIMNLVLLFKAPASGRTADRSTWAAIGRALVFMVVLIIASFPAAIIDLMGKKRSVLPNLLSVSPDRAPRILALITNAQSPMALDQNTILTGANSSGMNVEIEHDVFGSSFEQTPGQFFALMMTPILEKAACSDHNFRYIIHNGGSISFKYRLLRAGNTEEAAIKIASCQ